MIFNREAQASGLKFRDNQLKQPGNVVPRSMKMLVGIFGHDAQLIANKRRYTDSPTLAKTSAELFRPVFVP